MSCTIWNRWPAKAQREASYSSVLNKSCLQKDLQFTAKMYFFFFDSALTQGSMLESSASLTDYGGYLPWCTYCGIIVLLLSVITMCLIYKAQFPPLSLSHAGSFSTAGDGAYSFTHSFSKLNKFHHHKTALLSQCCTPKLQNYRTTLYPALWATPKIPSDTTWEVHSLG